MEGLGMSLDALVKKHREDRATPAKKAAPAPKKKAAAARKDDGLAGKGRSGGKKEKAKDGKKQPQVAKGGVAKKTAATAVAEPKNQKQPGGKTGGDAGAGLVVRNLDFNVTNQDILELFQ